MGRPRKHFPSPDKDEVQEPVKAESKGLPLIMSIAAFMLLSAKDKQKFHELCGTTTEN